MKISHTKSLFALFIVIGIFGACSGEQTGNVDSIVSNANQTGNLNVEIIAQDNVEDLSKIIKLPYTPLEATYSETNVKGKTAALNDKKIVGVLKFSTEETVKIAAAAAKYKPPVPSDIDAETWFPPELIAKSQETGDEFLKGSEYAANDFFQPPYLNGKLTRVNDSNYFVLELTSF